MSASPSPGWRRLALAAALLGLSAVLLGAVGSHAIALGDAAAEQRWSVALQIHYFQAAALLALVALAAAQADDRKFYWPGFLQVLGTLLFCGTLYLRALPPSWISSWIPGWIAPIGGILLLLGWCSLLLVLIRKPH